MNAKEQDGRWERWLINERHISADVAIQAGLTIDTQREELRIPVRNRSGETKFSKYRRAPWDTVKPKYRYEFGSEAWLFGSELLDTYRASGNQVLVVTEGELDTLVMRTLGYQAVSSTGGAHTWKAIWNTFLEGFDVVLAYDADVAGVTGALKVAQGTQYRIGWLPVQYGKDATDIVSKGGTEALQQAISAAHCYDIPDMDIEPEERVISLTEVERVLKAERAATMASRFGTPLHRDIALSWISGQKKTSETQMFDANREAERDPAVTDKIAVARTHPIRKLLKVSSEGFSKCVTHDEKSASLKVYQDNHAYCFGCSKRFDAIDIYRAINNCSFKEAVTALSS